MSSNPCAGQQCRQCDPLTGKCVSRSRGTPCSDGDENTINDACDGQGSCVGVSRCANVTCANLPCAQQECNPATGTCVTSAKLYLPEGTNCTVAGKTLFCQNGACTGLYQPCDLVSCPAGDCWMQSTAAACSGEEGKCACCPKALGTSCTATSATTHGVCLADGSCAQIPKCTNVQCPAATQCMQPSACQPSTGQCAQAAPKADGTPCDDFDADTLNDACKAGVCTGISRCANVSCDDLLQAPCFLAYSCDARYGKCVRTQLPAGFPCDDGNSNTENDQCTQQGVCTGTLRDRCVGVVCPPVSDCVEALGCNASTGTCETQARPDGFACAGNKGQCGSGSCQLCANCVAPDSCHRADCSADGECSVTALPLGTPCSDSDATTRNDVCVASGGPCQGQPLCAGVSCLAASDCVLSQGCAAATGLCQYAHAAEGTPCTAGLANGTCQQGQCVATADPCAGVVCNTPAVCHGTGQCDAASGACRYSQLADGIGCDDNNALTVNDVCQQGVCRGTDPCQGKTCSAEGQCTQASSCVRPSGQCGPVAYKANGLPCNDGNASTIDDACVQGKCVGQPVIENLCSSDCTPTDPCISRGTCVGRQCVFTFMDDGVDCNDGQDWTVNDRCDDGRCVGEDVCLSSQSACRKGTACRAPGSCASGVCFYGEPRNEGGTCSGGSCMSGECVATDLCRNVQCPEPVNPCVVSLLCDPQTGSCNRNGATRPDGAVCFNASAKAFGTCKGLSCQFDGTVNPSAGDDTSSSSNMVWIIIIAILALLLLVAIVAVVVLKRRRAGSASLAMQTPQPATAYSNPTYAVPTRKGPRYDMPDFGGSPEYLEPVPLSRRDTVYSTTDDDPHFLFGQPEPDATS